MYYGRDEEDERDYVEEERQREREEFHGLCYQGDPDD